MQSNRTHHVKTFFNFLICSCVVSVDAGLFTPSSFQVFYTQQENTSVRLKKFVRLTVCRKVIWFHESNNIILFDRCLLSKAGPIPKQNRNKQEELPHAQTTLFKIPA
ncbi:hypothetical protein CHARACLAT_014840 [Characodon lateralis]|uniref:Secreted protein n=1 Tax=Characodon lateralis TaxID=208331 RepID=A0ABU7DB52_9TELE|nr:hypothetical protein [Characodon lateralis]